VSDQDVYLKGKTYVCEMNSLVEAGIERGVRFSHSHLGSLHRKELTLFIIVIVIVHLRILVFILFVVLDSARSYISPRF